MRQRQGSPAVELTPAPFNLRTRVHEYGGRPFTARDGVVVGVGFADQRIYRLAEAAEPVPLTPKAAGRCATPISPSTCRAAASWRCAKTIAAKASL